MIPSPAIDAEFREIYHAAFTVVCEAAGCTSPVREVYRAAFLKDNPKHALAIIHRIHDRADQTALQLRHFAARLTALAAEIEASIPPEPPTDFPS